MPTLKKLDILEVVKRIKLGDKKAFEEFFCELQPSIFRFIFRYTFDSTISKDLCQETFIKFWNRRESLDTSGSPKAYLYKIARNLAINHMDRLQKMYSIEDESSIEFEHCHTPHKEYENKFLLKDFQKAIILLPEHCRVVFMLSRYHNFSYNEIASTLDVSVQTVKNQMNKSLAILRENLKYYNC